MKIRVGSLIQYLEDKDIGIVIGIVGTEPTGLKVKVWWMYEHYSGTFLFKPDAGTEIVLRY